jgi:ribosome-associated translation inhibitor RaiA
MPAPLRIASRRATLSPEEKAAIEALAAGLEDFFPRVIFCEVHVEGPGAHHRHGAFRVRLVISVPTRMIVISRQESGTLHESLAEAFKAAARRLEDHARRIRGDVKRRAEGNLRP